MTQLPLHLWDLPEGAVATLINVSENHTYRIDAPSGYRAVLRQHRIGYHSLAAIESELAWMDALRADGVIETPQAIPGRNGARIQEHAPAYVLFGFIDGVMPDETDALTDQFRSLGGIARKLHDHARAWTRPAGFTRMHWNLDTVFGKDAIWGNWRAAPGVDAAIATLLEQVEAKLRHDLTTLGQGPRHYGLIHADMRLANLLVKGPDIRLIDFDDCGFGWYMYDFAAAVSFMETRDDLGDLREAWLSGHGRAEADQIDAMVMLRRMALLAWIGSHAEAPEPQALAPHFASGTAELAERFCTSGQI